MSRSDIPPTNKKAVKCPDCGKWVTLQGYGGHRRFYHGEYQKNLKMQLLNQLINLRAMNKINKQQFESMSQILAPESKSSMQEVQYIKNFIDTAL
jgi:hypothetical protein